MIDLEGMDFGEQKLMDDSLDKYGFFSHQKKQNQSDFLSNYKGKNQGSLEKTSDKNEEAPIKTTESLEKQIEEDKKSKCKPLLTFTQLTMIAQQNLENGLTLRQIYEEQQALKQKQKFSNNRYLFLAHFKSIQQDHPEMIAQSIEYLFHISKQYELSQNAKKTLTKESITIHFSELIKKGGRQFYLHSIELIETHLLRIIQEFNTSRQFEQSQLKIQIELFCCFLKIAWNFQDYIPQKMRPKIWNINLSRIAKLCKISPSQLQILKDLFLENQHKIAFFTSNEFQLNLLWTTYYLLLLKNKYEKIPVSSVLKFPLEEIVQSFKANKLKERQEKINEINLQKVTLTSLFHADKLSKKNNNFSAEKSMQIIKQFEEFISKGEIYQQNHPIFDELAQKYQGNRKQIKKRFVRYMDKNKSLLLKFNNDLSNYKNALITRQMIQKPQCCYEEAARNIFNFTSAYIEQKYFKNNLFSLLLKEVQYQQFKYLGRVFRGITQRIRHGKSVLFLDSFSLRQERGQESGLQESPCISIAVTLKGALLCRTPNRPISGIELIKEYRPILQGSLPSIILLFDDQFPFSLELDKREEVYLLRKTHTLLLLPRTSLVPSPCRVIADCLKAGLKQRLSWEGFEKAIQGAIHELDERQVKNIVDKEWEKVKKLVVTCNPVPCDEQIKEKPNIKQQGQKMIGEFEEFEGIERAIECEMPEPKELNPFQNISLQNPEKMNEQEKEEKQIEWASQQFLEEQQGQKVRVSNQVPSLPQPIMENLLSKSIQDLRTALTHLLSRNKKGPFNYNGNYPIRIHQRLPIQQFIDQFNKAN